MTDETDDLLLQRVTAHEVGHVLTARIFDIETNVTIVPGDGFLGKTFGPKADAGSCLSNSDAFYAEAKPLMSQIGVPRIDAAELIAHAQVRAIELVAGRVAEIVAFPAIVPLPSPLDRKESRNYASLFCCSQNAIDVFLKYAAHEARSLITENIDVFNALREALLERKTMQCAEIDAVIHAALVRRDQKIEHARRKHMLQTNERAQKFLQDISNNAHAFVVE
jgi:hypothetical protein